MLSRRHFVSRHLHVHANTAANRATHFDHFAAASAFNDFTSMTPLVVELNIVRVTAEFCLRLVVHVRSPMADK
jgi:hypothetical protein